MYIRWRWRWRYFIIVFHKVLTQKTSIMAAILESFSSNFFYLLSLSHRILRSAPWYHHWDTFHIYLVVMQINNSTSRTIYIYIYIQTYLWICIKTLVCYIYIYRLTAIATRFLLRSSAILFPTKRDGSDQVRKQTQLLFVHYSHDRCNIINVLFYFSLIFSFPNVTKLQ